METTYNPKTEKHKKWRKNNRDHANELRRKYYKNNPEVYRAMDKRKRAKLLSKQWELKNRPCIDCGESFPPYVMQFDHVSGEKENCVSRMTSYKKMLEEALKCEIVCANCHAIRTWTRKNKINQ